MSLTPHPLGHSLQLIAHSRWRYALIAAAAAAVYAWSLRNGFLLVDDDLFIYENPLVQEAGVDAIFQAFLPSSHARFFLYIPLTLISWQLNALVSGTSPLAFHLTDLAIHTCNSMMVFWIINRMTGRQNASLIAAMFFVVHPINVEAVVWASQRKDLLSATFAFLSLIAYVRYAEDARSVWLWMSLAGYAMGLLSKVGILSLPLLLLTLDLLSGRRDRKRMLAEKLPYVIVAIPVALLGTSVGEQVLQTLDLPTMLLLGAKSMALLVLLAVAPLHLSALRWEPGPVTLTNPVFLASASFALAYLCVTILLLIRSSDHSRVAGFGLAWVPVFLVTTFPSALKSGLLHSTSEKYAYVPLVGLLLAAVVVLSLVLERWKARWGRADRGFGVLIVLALVTFGARAATYARTWRDTTTLNEYILSQSPSHPLALGNLGALAEKKGDVAVAREYYDRALKADPSNIAGYLNAGSRAFQDGRFDDMLDILRPLPAYMTARQLRGDTTVRSTLLRVMRDVIDPHDPELARAVVSKIVELVPDDVNAREVLRNIR
ncbi:MAG: hypothetical protein Greene041619_224 [Candidatus Peregrinibacteria bacterium Greene0416_19]|nr:MAG: hypothetical protein Greene041619_224 [Candidatus Peregrinibacteria bacterium Greene0416_19]